MKKLLLGICYLFISHTVLSQQISGRVTDAATGTAVAAATVELGKTTSTLTNDSGFFVFKWPGQSESILKVSSIGYRSVVKTVTPGTDPVTVSLERIDLMMQPVEVKAIRAGEKAPFTKTNLSKSDIEKLNIAQDIPYLLNQFGCRKWSRVHRPPYKRF